MIFAKKLCFEDMPYQPAAGEVILEQATASVDGVHLQGQHLYQRGRYKVEVRAGLPYINILSDYWTPYGISMVVEMDAPFYIDAYLGGSSIGSRTSATSNPYSGTGKAQSNKMGYNGQAQSDGIFGGAGGSGHDDGVAWAIGGGNAVGNTPYAGGGSGDAGGSSGSALWFVAEGKEVGSLKADGSPDAYKCFHCGGHGGTAAGRTYIFGGGGGAYGGGAGGRGYERNSERGGNGAGGAGGNLSVNGAGIGAGKANRQGGLAYFDGTQWIDVFNSMQKGDGLGYDDYGNIASNIRITYLGGSVISDEYVDIRFTVNSSGFDGKKGVQYIAIYWPEEGQVGALEPNVLYDISAAGVYNVRAPLVRKGQKVTVVLRGWFSNNQRPNDFTFEQIKYSEFTASDATLEYTVNATTRTLTLGLNSGVINGLTNCTDLANNLMTLYYENTGNVSATGSNTTITGVGTLSIGSSPITMPQTVSVQQLGLPNEVFRLENQVNIQQPGNQDYRLHLITEGFETLLAVEPDSGYTIQENVFSYYWTVTYYLQTDVTAGELGGATETVDNGLLTDTIETDSTQGELPEIGIW